MPAARDQEEQLMAQIAFGVTIRPSPESGTLPEMQAANARLLAAAQAHDLSAG